MLQEVLKAGVPRRRFRLGRLPVVMIGTGFSAIPHNHFFKRPYSLNDQEIEWGWRIHSFGIDSTRAFEWCLFSLWRLPRNLWALLSTETSIEKPYKFVYVCMSHGCVQPSLVLLAMLIISLAVLNATRGHIPCNCNCCTIQLIATMCSAPQTDWCLYSMDWTTRMDYWTGLLDSPKLP